MNKRKTAWIIIIVCFVLLPILGIVSLIRGLSGDFSSFLDPEGQTKLTESFVKNEGKGDNKLLLLRLDGVITNSATTPSPFGGSSITPDYVTAQIKRAKEDPTVKGIILKINSPGGSAVASDLIYREIIGNKEDFKIIAQIEEVGASGGYYIAAAADKIIAHPSSLVGSIGVRMDFYNMQELFEEKLGIRSTTIKSGKFKDIGSEQRPMTTDESEILQAIVDETYSEFVDAVAKGRNLDRNIVLAFADGSIFTGKKARDKKLVDLIGDGKDAEKALVEMLEIGDNYSVIEYKRPFDFVQSLFSSTPAFSLEKLLNIAPKNTNPSLQYLWTVNN